MYCENQSIIVLYMYLYTKAYNITCTAGKFFDGLVFYVKCDFSLARLFHLKGGTVFL